MKSKHEWRRLQPGSYRRYVSFWARVERCESGWWAWFTCSGRGGLVLRLADAKFNAERDLDKQMENQR